MIKETLLERTTEAERFRLLVEAVTDYAIYMLDPNGIVSSWNAGAERIKGYKASEILGHSFAEFYEQADRAAGTPQRVLAIARRDGKFQAEGWRVRKDGTRFWAFVIVDAIYDNGELIGFAKITRDLTERRQAEEELRRSEELFRRLVEGVTDYAVYMLDPSGIVSNWNAGAQRIKGYGPDEIVGRHFSIFYTEEDRNNGEPARSLAIAAREGRFEAEAWRQRKDGTRFWANVVIDAIRDSSGRLIGFAKITRDITERREAQLALDRTREALMHSQKIEAIGKLTGGVAHDFNNLLTVVLGSLDLLRRYVPSDDPRIARLLDNALQGAQRGATLTQRMLAFARRQELDLRPVDLVELTRGMRDLLQRSLGPQIAIETRFPLALDRVTADPNQLETSLLNLAVNARDAMPAGGILTIAARNEVTVGDSKLRAGRYVRLTLSDTGEGMDEETLARATEPFFTTKGTGKGTGLGLSMVHGMAEQLGGQLILHSKPGEGTAAEIWLPAAERPVEIDVPEAPSPAIERMRPLTILAVDDDALVLANTCAMLEDLGHTVFLAYSGEQALEKFERTSAIDLVITDHAMPKMTGTDLAERIQARRPDVPIILATGYAELPVGTAARLPRLSKPYRQDALAHAIINAVKTRREASS
jgi:PAS domain S-box-containing protein